ncbi:MAG: hypothetical protein AB1451_07075 [Nitrospirota bacterium]
MQGKTMALRILITAACLLVMLPIVFNSLRDVEAGPAHQSDRIGPVYPIIEPDWSTWLPKQIQKRLAEQPLTVSRNQIRAALNRQVSDFDLPEVKTPRTYTIDPSVRVPHPGTDPLGRTLAVGEPLNPMTYLAGFRPIVVIDSRKERHVEWAKRALTETNSIVLTLTGDGLTLSARLGAPVYPAPPQLLERLSITRVPVVISGADGRRVRVEEVIP